MICKVCGHEDDKYFSICPYCGEETSSENENFDEFDKGDLNAENINKISESEELHVQRYIPKVDVSHYNTPLFKRGIFLNIFGLEQIIFRIVIIQIY